MRLSGLSSLLQGEIISDLSKFVCRRVGGSCIKHRVKENWLKMYDKAGIVLRVFGMYDCVVAPSASCVSMVSHHYPRLV
jgi:hypothetical protein